ncbi:hypothetical protein H6G33_10680 [Calothrix sp. FACHB-1219]|uniref:hypothetical protein n=1 Tax=unclassified Calothrix TaxID=2619626 RepID=UPI00168574F5|nr:MULTISPECIES: hypothetical protein [unclassified Calothrix]MBD2201813.1 hypothetical protein [Calothrix sp. FACHB-168]MBD2217499.1 hypothetical protein [Calothrix sp. FACHB-1219]
MSETIKKTYYSIEYKGSLLTIEKQYGGGYIFSTNKDYELYRVDTFEIAYRSLLESPVYLSSTKEYPQHSKFINIEECQVVKVEDTIIRDIEAVYYLKPLDVTNDLLGSYNDHSDGAPNIAKILKGEIKSKARYSKGDIIRIYSTVYQVERILSLPKGQYDIYPNALIAIVKVVVADSLLESKS